MNSQSIPQNRTAENAALSLISHSPHVLHQLPWNRELFFADQNQQIFDALENAMETGRETDFVAITSDLESQGKLEAAGGHGAIAEILLTLPGPNASQAAYYFRDLQKALTARKTSSAAREALNDLELMLIEPGEFAETVAAAAQGPEQAKRVTLSGQLDQLCADLTSTTPKETFGFGLQTLNRHLAGGIQRGELGVVAAATSGGKSILLCMATLAAGRAGKPVAVFSLEMPAKDILRRMGANMAGVPLKGQMDKPTPHDMNKTTQAITVLRGMQLHIEDSLTSLSEIEREIRRLARLKKADLVIVDYLQLVENTTDANREQAVAAIAQRLKNLATSCGIAILTASQLNEEGRLRESRAIGHHADIVLVIGDGKIKVEKFRNGPRDTFSNVTMRGELGRFEEVTSNE